MKNQRSLRRIAARGVRAPRIFVASLFAALLATSAMYAASQRRPPLPVPPAKQKVRAESTAASKSAPSNAQNYGPVTLPPPLPPPQLTQADLTAFFDGLVPLQIERDDIAGAVVAVVQDGKVIFAKGYGYSDLKDKKLVSPEDTLFRIGSISKLFTWTAVMQLVEQGKINLDADVNQYLDFRVPEPLGKITMRDLMTHTPGFEEAIKDLIVTDGTMLPSLRDYLVNHMPQQIFAPGTTGAYSNYGATLAGYIVQRVSGQNFDDYIEQHIFTSLGMAHATFRQPLPPNLAPLMSDGYQLASGGAKKFEFVTAFPAGGVSVSAMDITHFMIAHLNDGEYNGVRILQPDTVKLMHSRQYAPDPRVHAMCLGFYEESRNGHRIIGHGGDTQYFHSDLHLILDANTGLFISYNSLGRGDVEPRGPLFQKFLDRYFPYTPPAEKPLSTAAADARAVAGLYIASRRPQTNMLYLISVIGEAAVTPAKDGKLIVAGMKDVNGQPTQWVETAPQLWRDTNDPQNTLAFSRMPDGRWQIALDFPFEVYQQVPWTQSKTLVQTLLICSYIIFLLSILLWPVAALIRRHYGFKLVFNPTELRARRWTRAAAFVLLAYWSLLVGGFVVKGESLGFLSSRMDWWFRLLQVIGWLGVFATLIAIWNFLVSWRTKSRWWGARLIDTLFLLACLASIWIVWFGHLLAFSLRY
jgi:CubicO group peptidase (beta-lactamase class C family)